MQDVTEIGVLEQRLMQGRNALRMMERTLREQNVQLLAANAELRRLDEAKSSFVSIAAHELRTPLTSILGYVEMLEDGDAGPLNDRQLDYLRIVESGAERLLHLTRDLLDLARLESGRFELVLQPTDLRDLVGGVLAEHRPQLEARRSFHRASRRRAPALGAGGSRPGGSDRRQPGRQRHQVLSPATPLCVSLALAPEPGFIRVAVQDQGPGISPEDQARLFKPFARTANALQSGEQGAGLGLYITRSLVELHGGRIWVESRPGQGATFALTLPVATPTA